MKELHEAHQWSISCLCKVLELPRCSYYKWLNRKETKEELENHELAQLILEYDERFNHILGYRRMTRWINKLNSKHYNRKRVRRLMKLLGVKSIIRKKREKYESTAPEISAENVLSRNFNATKPNEKWTTDVTEFKVAGTKQKLYLSAILDLYDRSVVSYEISTRNDNSLVFRTYEEAVKSNPGATPLLHSDRGFQYTSKVFQTKLGKAGIRQSMSRVGRCIDNGPTEGFWGIIKSEMYYLKKYDSLEELREDIIQYIHFYNYERLQERFDDRTPMAVRIAALTAENVAQYPIKENKRIQKYYANLKSKQEQYSIA
ncbi:MAG: IS3 family transposase [Erysipelotrichaceae bacterium]|nr:IS3 family transposase [Erysipelotrichaceae bacterium]